MKYTILINQAGIAAANLTDKTNFDDWAVLDYIAGWQANHRATLRDGHVWINFKHLLSEMPLLRTATKQGVSDIIKKLKDLGLVTAVYDFEKRVYLKLTPLYHDAVGFQSCPKIEEGVKPDGQGVKQALQGGVKQAGHTADYQFSADYQESISTDVRKPRRQSAINLEGFEPFWKVYPKQRIGGRPNAEQAYSKALARNHPPWVILQGATAYAASREVAEGYAKGAAAWLNDDRFLNYYGEVQNGKRNRSNGSMATAALAEIAREAQIAESSEDWQAHGGGCYDPGGASESFDRTIDAMPRAVESADTGGNIQDANAIPGRNGLEAGNGNDDARRGGIPGGYSVRCSNSITAHTTLDAGRGGDTTGGG